MPSTTLKWLSFPTGYSCLCHTFSSVQFSRSVVSASLRPHKSQHARPPCPSPTPGVHPDSRPSSQWCHPAISSSVVLFSCCPQSLPSSESFPMSQLFTKVTESQVRYYIARFSWHLRLGHCYFYENFGKWGTKCLALDGEMWNSSKCIFFLTSFYWYTMHYISFPELLFFDSHSESLSSLLRN